MDSYPRMQLRRVLRLSFSFEAQENAFREATMILGGIPVLQNQNLMSREFVRARLTRYVPADPWNPERSGLVIRSEYRWVPSLDAVITMRAIYVHPEMFAGLQKRMEELARSAKKAGSDMERFHDEFLRGAT